MSAQATITLIILGATLLALASQRLRPDLVALCTTLALILSGVLTAEEAFLAFGQPVIILIAAIYVLGAALYETGVAAMVANRLLRLADRGLTVLLVVLVLTAGLLSGILSSLLVVVVMMPAVLRLAHQARLAPSQLLLPVVMGASMGNLLTIIGTVSNLIVSDLLSAAGHSPLGFFAMMPYGVVSLLLAVAWFALIGQRLLRREVEAETRPPSLDEVEHAYEMQEELYRLRVQSASDLIGRRLDQVPLSDDFRLNVVAIRSHRGALHPAEPERVVAPDDVLIVSGAKGDALQAASLHNLEPKGSVDLEEVDGIKENVRLAEAMIPFRSELVGKTLAEAGFRRRYGLNILAVHRGGRPIRRRLRDLRLGPGDTLLVQGTARSLHRIGGDQNLILVTRLGPQPGDVITPKAKVTLAILAIMIGTVVTGVLSLATAGLAASIALILTRSISLERAYNNIEGSILVLVGGMLPLAFALQETGAAEAVAEYLASFSPAIGAAGALGLLYLFTVVITQIVSNSAAAALMTPIAVQLAVTMGQSPVSFALMIAVAVTTSYITPLTNTDNLLVREAGRYTLRDYLIQGVPLFLLQSAAVVLLFALQE
ncbi:MAG: SLC13 family permease [Anaerolineae bacterium]|nr:SLC13 family permease [Anaerolineae bacterium]